MSAKTIRRALGVVEDDPGNELGWQTLAATLGLLQEGSQGPNSAAAEVPPAELRSLLEASRKVHEERREYPAVARLLNLEIALASGTPHAADLQTERARVLDEELFDDEAAVNAYRELLVLRPEDPDAEQAIENSAAKRVRWRALVERYLTEAETSKEAAFKSSLLVSAAEAAYRYGRLENRVEGAGSIRPLDPNLDTDVVRRLEHALAIDPDNRRAEQLLEHVHRDAKRFDALARAMESYAEKVSIPEERALAFLRLARVLSKDLGAPERSIGAYERVFEIWPGHPTATSCLVEVMGSRGMWEDVADLYARQLHADPKSAEAKIDALAGLAEVTWKRLGDRENADLVIERLRGLDPSHPLVLEYTRLGERVMESVAPRAPSAPPASRDVARLVERAKEALRQDPGNAEARRELRMLYRETGAFAALIDVLRGELERLPTSDPARLPTLRELAQVVRDHAQNDAVLVTVLTQIISLAPDDKSALRDLAKSFDALGRHRDLLATETRLAELETEVAVKADLYRSIAARWADQFANPQNALEAYEKLHALVPTDADAREKLKELYSRRRAYQPLFDLLESEAAAATAGPARRAVWTEMAKLAADKLEKGDVAIRLYRAILDEDPSAADALEALERQAERDRDFETLAFVLERRIRETDDATQKLALLQRLGSLFSERLHDAVRAMDAWRRVLEVSPGNPKALRVLRDAYLAAGDFDALTALYEDAKDWEGLVEVLSTAADRATESDLKIELSFRAADIYANRLGAPERAFRAYERVLTARPDDARAARALVKLYEKEEKWARLPALYDILLSHSSGDVETIEYLQKLENVTGARLGDRATAFGYAVLRFKLARDRVAAASALEESARATGLWDRFYEVASARLAEADVGADERRLLTLRLAEVAASELGRIDEAVEHGRKLVETGDEAAIQFLDRLLRTTDRRDDLRWLQRQRVERASGTARTDLLVEWALLEEEAFGAPDRAIALYREVTDVAREHAIALRGLSRLLRGSGQLDDALELLERERSQRQGKDLLRTEIEIARLLLELRRPADAFVAAERALVLSDTAPEVIALFEDLLKESATRGRAANVLEDVFSRAGRPDRQVETLEVMLATAAAKDDRIAIFARLVEVHEKALGSPATAFDVAVRAVREFSTSIESWDRLNSLAVRTGKIQVFIDALAAAVPPTGESGLPEYVELDLSERIATLYDDKLGEIDRARPYLERILAREAGNDWAFVRLKQILTTREEWAALDALYVRAIDAATEPGRRVQLLSEVALVAEEITGDLPRAIAYYERIVELEPTHEQADRALDTLYGQTAQWEAQGRLLARRLETASGAEMSALKLRLGALQLERLGDPKLAFSFLAEVVESEPSNDRAKDLLESLLPEPSLRAKVARVLEGVYAARDEARNLARVLGIELETVTDRDERRELVRRVAELFDVRLTDFGKAFDAYAELVPLEPDDGTVRARFLALSAQLSFESRAAEVLLDAAGRTASVPVRAEVLMQAANVFDAALADPVRAEEVYRQVLTLDPDAAEHALPAARSLEALVARGDRPRELRDVLVVRARLEQDPASLRDLRRRLGDLAENVLNDVPGAIEAWKARVDDDPTDDEGLFALDRLYGKAGKHRERVEVLRARERRTDDPDLQRQLMLRVASLFENEIGDVPEAILAYRHVVDDFGADPPVLTSLANLHRKAGEWQDVADVIEQHLALATGTERATLLAELGDVRRTHLTATENALDAYRQALAIEASHGPSRAALEGLFEDADFRREAASILLPLYEAAGEHERVLAALDVEISMADVTREKLAALAKAAHVAEGSLGDVARAFRYVARAVEASGSEPTFAATLDEARRLSDRAGTPADFVALVEHVQTDVSDDAVRADATRMAADIARDRLSDPKRARALYEKTLELRPDDRSALESLDAILVAEGDWSALHGILARRVDLAPGDDAKRALLHRRAEVEEVRLDDPATATSTYEDVLELGLDDAAFRALERLHRAAKRWDELLALHERELAASADAPEKSASLLHRIAEVALAEQGDAVRAFDSLERALEFVRDHAPTVAMLESLLGPKEHRARAATLLEPVYLARLDGKKVMETLEARIGVSEDSDERKRLLERLAKLQEEQEENYVAALDTWARMLAEEPLEEATWAELERVARVANAPGRLAGIFAKELAALTNDDETVARLLRRTGQLFDETGDKDEAIAHYRRALAVDPAGDRESFVSLDKLLRESGKPTERTELLVAGLEHRDEPKERIALFHTLAEIAETELRQADKAIEWHRSALEIEESDADSLEALSRLYFARERFREFADHTRRRAELSLLPEDEARFRFELAESLAKRLSDIPGALDEYEAVLRLADKSSTVFGQTTTELEALFGNAEHRARAVEILRPVYESASDHRKLLRANDVRLAIAADAFERVNILLENAALLETKDGNALAALDSALLAVAEDPSSEPARRETERLAGATGRWDDVVLAYETATAKADDRLAGELWVALARIHDKRRDDPRRALVAWTAAYAKDESDVTILDEMDALATLLSDWKALVHVLEKKTGFAASDEERASLWRRVGEARRDMLDDPEGAIVAYEKALEGDPESAFTLDNLIPLHEAKKDHARLVDLYRRRLALTTDDDIGLRFQLSMDAALSYEVGLGDRREAIALVRDAHSVEPKNPDVLERLDRLYLAEGASSDLLEILDQRLSLATDDAARRTFEKRIGTLRAKELGDSAGALAAYRRVLEGGYDAEVVDALLAIATTEPEHVPAVAVVVSSFLKGAGRFEDLATVLRLEVDASDDPRTKADRLRTLAAVEGDDLGDAPKAFASLMKAFAAVPDDETVHPLLEARAVPVGKGAWKDYADALAERASNSFDAPWPPRSSCGRPGSRRNDWRTTRAGRPRSPVPSNRAATRTRASPGSNDSTPSSRTHARGSSSSIAGSPSRRRPRPVRTSGSGSRRCSSNRSRTTTPPSDRSDSPSTKCRPTHRVGVSPRSSSAARTSRRPSVSWKRRTAPRARTKRWRNSTSGTSPGNRIPAAASGPAASSRVSSRRTWEIPCVRNGHSKPPSPTIRRTRRRSARSSVSPASRRPGRALRTPS
ncbi:MAG: hypothetical protein U0169_18105 [Polyangiaceae bacterium]